MAVYFSLYLTFCCLYECLQRCYWHLNMKDFKNVLHRRVERRTDDDDVGYFVSLKKNLLLFNSEIHYCNSSRFNYVNDSEKSVHLIWCCCCWCCCSDLGCSVYVYFEQIRMTTDLLTIYMKLFLFCNSLIKMFNLYAWFTRPVPSLLSNCSKCSISKLGFIPFL